MMDDMDINAGVILEGTPVEEVGRSYAGREIYQMEWGKGPLKIFMWSQMHGDEPTATAALFDVFEYFKRHREDPMVRRILSQLTLHVVPILNPDGAERFQRRNAQSIDVNRDALRLQTPEGRGALPTPFALGRNGIQRAEARAR